MSRRVSRSIRLADPVNGSLSSPLLAGKADHRIARTHATVTPTLTLEKGTRHPIAPVR
jgi:hypothetical protein